MNPKTGFWYEWTVKAGSVTLSKFLRSQQEVNSTFWRMCKITSRKLTHCLTLSQSLQRFLTNSSKLRVYLRKIPVPIAITNTLTVLTSFNHCGFPSLNLLIKTLNYIILIVLPSSSRLWPQDHSLQEIQDLWSLLLGYQVLHLVELYLVLEILFYFVNLIQGMKAINIVIFSSLANFIKF
jgi:hypothetical protein